MFYEFPTPSEMIKQGDIFINIPYVAFSFSKELSILDLEKGEKPTSITWEEIVDNKQDVAAILGINSVPAIVATQTCDVQRKDYITLCEIVELSKIPAFEKHETELTKTIAKKLIRHNREMPGIFYLPSDENIGFSTRMAVNFSSTIRLFREDLQKFTANRKGRLNKTGYEHFREKLSHFFHRYAWDEWYILNKEEIDTHERYSKLKVNQRYDYQK